MNSPVISQGPARIVITLAAFVLVVAGMREAKDLLVPFLMALFLAIITAPSLAYLQQRKLPMPLALTLVILAVVAVGMLLGVFIGNSVEAFSEQLPLYQEKLQQQMAALLAWLGQWGIELPRSTLSNLLDPSRAMRMAAQGLSSLGGLLTNTFLILVTMIFLLVEAAGFPTKLRAIMADPEQSWAAVQRFLDSIKHYMAIKTATSLLTGTLVALWLWIIGVDFPLLWGLVAFLLNFVPNIGSLIAAVPAVLLALVQLGSGAALWTALGYLLINNLIGNLVEPRFMGRGLGLSSLVVFLSLVFWGWVLGMIGMFLSVPLTMTVKIALDSHPQTRWIATLLGPDIDATPDPG